MISAAGTHVCLGMRVAAVFTCRYGERKHSTYYYTSALARVSDSGNRQSAMYSFPRLQQQNRSTQCGFVFQDVSCVTTFGPI
jgi:hypothetical protein